VTDRFMNPAHWERNLTVPGNKARVQNCSVLTPNVTDRKLTRPRITWLTLKEQSLYETHQIADRLQWHELTLYRLSRLCESLAVLTPTTAPYSSQALTHTFISHAHTPLVRLLCEIVNLLVYQLATNSIDYGKKIQTKALTEKKLDKTSANNVFIN